MVSRHSSARVELDGYLQFPPGWDGYSGKPFNRRLIFEARVLLGSFVRRLGSQLDSVIPGPASDGSVDLEFRVGDRTLIVTLYEDSDPFYVFSDESEESEEGFRSAVERFGAGPGTSPPAFIAYLCERLVRR